MDEFSREAVGILGIVIFIVFLVAVAPWLALVVEIYYNWTEEAVRRIHTRYKAKRMRREAEEADRRSQREKKHDT